MGGIFFPGVNMALPFVVSPSTRAGKKFMAVFPDGTVTHFGAAGYMDYPSYFRANPAVARAKRRQYIARHGGSRVGAEDWTDLRSAGALSRWILWEYPTMKQAVAAYGRRVAATMGRFDDRVAERVRRRWPQRWHLRRG